MASLTVPTWPRQDAIDLHRAFKGFGCDSTTVIGILAHRDAAQRAAIQHEYRAVFNQDLARRIASELSGHHKRAMLLWVLDPATRDATILKQALTGDVTDLRAATEVICSRTPSQLQIMRGTYRARFGCHVEHDVTERTSGDHQRLLLAYLAIPRAEGFAGGGGGRRAGALQGRGAAAGHGRARVHPGVQRARVGAHGGGGARVPPHVRPVAGEGGQERGVGELLLRPAHHPPLRRKPRQVLRQGAAQGDEGAGHARHGAHQGGGDAGGDRHAVHQGGVPQDVQALPRRRHPRRDFRELPHIPSLPRRPRPRLLLIV